MTTPTDDDREAAASIAPNNERWGMLVRAGKLDDDTIVQLCLKHRLLGQRQGIEAKGWQDIASAPRDEMLLSWADGMVRLVMWEAGQWVQVGATIEPGWYEPTHWMPLPAAPEA